MSDHPNPRPDGINLSPALLAGAAGTAAALTYLLTSRKRTRRAFTFAGRTTIITGGSRGLGLAMARLIGAEGGHVFLLARDPAELVRAQDDLLARGVRGDTLPCDVRDPDAVRDAVDRIVRQTGRIDVLINNAGVIQTMPFEHARVEDFDDSLRTHFWGPLFLIRACLPVMRRHGGGRIVNISSIGGRVAVPHLTPYSVGKFALTALSDGLHAELAKDGIAVTTVTPWLMRTGSHRETLTRGQHEAEARWFSLLSATSLTAIDARDAAAQIVHACRLGRARVSPGWPSRASQTVQALMPELTAAALAAFTRWLLPGPSRDAGADVGRLSRNLDLGWLESLLPTAAARQFNQR
jgi:NAD(P)-dependent dehydrogenase (short-subunit alcohol dehydrogenase family)